MEGQDLAMQLISNTTYSRVGDLPILNGYVKVDADENALRLKR